MPTTDLKMSSLIDEALDYIHQWQERPAPVTVGSNALDTTSDNQLTLVTNNKVSASDVIEIGQELLLVTGKSADADPVYTVSRGYLGTTASAHATAVVGGVNPLYPRYTVQRAIERCVTLMNAHLPFVTSETYTRVTDKPQILLPDDTIDVLEVGYVNNWTNRYEEIGGWTLVHDLPYSVAVEGKLLRIPVLVSNETELIVKRQVAYEWSTNPVTETSTITVPLASEDLPILFAAARLVSAREISRSELDKVEEWNHEAAVRGGVNLRLLQSLWSEYYRRVDEVKTLQRVPRRRVYRHVPHVYGRYGNTPRWIP